MGKKMKLSLDDLKIQSFVTSVDNELGRRVKGGDHRTYIFACSDACGTGICPPGEREDGPPEYEGTTEPHC